MNGVNAEAGTEPVGGVVEVVPPLEKSRLAVLRSKSWAWVTSPVLTRRFKVFSLVPVPLVIAAVDVADVVALVLGVVVVEVVVLELVALVLDVLGATDGGGIDRKLVASGPANCGVPKMSVLVLELVVALAAGVVRVITPDEVDTPDGVGTSIGANTLATGVGTVGVVVAVGVVVVGVVVVGVVVVGVVVVGVVVVGVVVVGVVVVGVVVVGVAICATLTPEAVESATAVIEAQAISDKSLVSFMADLPDSEHQGNAILSFLDPNTP